jgi:predicted transcriptional regulator
MEPHFTATISFQFPVCPLVRPEPPRGFSKRHLRATSALAVGLKVRQAALKNSARRARHGGIARRNGWYYHTSQMQTISLKIPDELLAELERAARARRVPKSVLVRESLETALRPRARRGATSCFDLSGDLAGSLKGLPRDLAHNPRYLDGFGE